ncbi:MAG: OmpA family protein [Alphaproteobacteria bacterium]|nr:OmpA family protein [Alphaproteobacteria bacterium]
MRLKITSLLATAALALSACGSSTEDCVDVSGQGGIAGPAAIAAAEAGCAPGSTADFVENVGDRVFFDFDRSFVRADGMETLKRQAAWLAQYPQYVVTINGHCDKRGTVEYNLALGERRAFAAKEQLAAMGVDPSRIKIVSYGKNRPIVEQDGSEWGYQQNRVAITVLD